MVPMVERYLALGCIAVAVESGGARQGGLSAGVRRGAYHAHEKRHCEHSNQRVEAIPHGRTIAARGQPW